MNACNNREFIALLFIIDLFYKVIFCIWSIDNTHATLIIWNNKDPWYKQKKTENAFYKEPNSKILENKNPRNILMTIRMLYCFAKGNNVFHAVCNFQGNEKIIYPFFYKLE